ncbi:ATP-dependent helicase [Candidatus Nomurabacteria bacterium]|nr:ATP-dependent helicase [Candidatus Nomurabacteria bacterium]
MSAFDEAYKALNPEQKRAVETIDGPIMVVAGPGTGKTQILTLRIANILAKTDTEPEQILALTFTEAAAHNMRRRLAELIGNPAYRVVISTFHGFCNEVIRRFPEDFPRVIGSSAITDVEQAAVVEEIIENGSFVLLKPFGDRLLYVRDIVSTMSELKREGVTPERFAALVAKEKDTFAHIEDLYHEKGAYKGKMKGEYIKLERKLLKNEELAQVYAKYQDKLAERKAYDFSDMILEVLTALETNPTLLQLLQEEHQYVLVDEHQDTNNAQNRIIELLMSYHGDRPNLFVVGDEKQAIFRFQGASIENFQYFKNKYKDVRLIALTHNYRSTQAVLDAADSLLSSGLKKNAPHAEVPIQIGEFENPASERYFVAHDIKEKIKSGVVPNEISILYRNNAHAFLVAGDLARLGIPYQIESDQDLFTQSDVARLLIIMRAVAYYGDDMYVAEFLHVPLFGIDPLDAYKLLRKGADAKEKILYDLLTHSEVAEIKALGEKMKAWVRESKKKDLLAFFEHIMRDAGMLEDMLGKPDAPERFDAINALFDQVRQLVARKSDATLADFFAYLATVQKHKLFIKRQTATSTEGKVRLMTVHKSKGLEFGHVYLIGATEGTFGGKIDRDRLPLIESVYKMV